MTEFLKRTWAVVDLGRLDENVHILQSRLRGGEKLMAVVKADGYGHGDKPVARELSALGVDFFAVSNLAEAQSLRRAGITDNILILGFTPPAMAAVLAESGVTQTVFSTEYALLLDAEAERAGVSVRIHIKLDTGMSRIGFDASDPARAAEEVQRVCSLPHLDALGLFSHLSSADSLDTSSLDYTKMQADRYRRTVDELAARGLRFSFLHLQNSAGIAFYPDFSFDYARAGIVLYGVAPSGEPLPFGLHPLMELKTVISMVKTIPKGTAVSYGRTFVSPRDMTIATVPIGYADGYPRALSNKGWMLVRGRRAPILGNICMDQLMLDVSDIPNARMGDIVTVVGADGGEQIGFNELAELTGTIGYELMCLIGRRVPRVYVKDGKTVDLVDYVAE